MLAQYRIGEGGPLRRFETRVHLTRLSTQIVLVVAVTWLPIMVLGLVTQWQTGRPEPLLYDAAVHVRLLVAAPVLLKLDHLFPVVCTRTLVQLARQSFVPEAARPRLD